MIGDWGREMSRQPLIDKTLLGGGGSLVSLVNPLGQQSQGAGVWARERIEERCGVASGFGMHDGLILRACNMIQSPRMIKILLRSS